MCVGAEALRARSAALSKLIVRTEQNNFAGGGAVAGLVLRAPVEQMLWAPKTHHDILYRMLRTRQKAAPRRSPESWGAQNVPRTRAGKCRNAAGARTVCAAAGARWEDRRQHSQPAAVSITLCTALPACGREHHSIVDSTTGLPAVSFRSSTALQACRPITSHSLFSPLSFRTRLNDERWQMFLITLPD